MKTVGDYYGEADPINLARAIVRVQVRWDQQKNKPGREELVVSSRKWRPILVREIEEEWCRIADVDIDDDLFPYHESYVVRKWVEFRKMNEATKNAWANALLKDE